MKAFLPVGYRRISDEVYYAPPPPHALTPTIVSTLGVIATLNPSGKARICLHADPSDAVHDMLIALHRKVKMVPHQHSKKAESFQVIEGAMRVTLYDGIGGTVDSIELDADRNAAFHLRLPPKLTHVVTPLTDLVVFREVTQGPFRPEDTVYPSWTIKLGQD